MLEQTLTDIYTKFKIHFYQEVFKSLNAGNTTLSTMETICMEIIHALQEPTVNMFASFIQVSSPNAAYKVNNLIQKGYIEKVRSAEDKREYHLRVTPKYFDYYNMNQNYLSEIAKRAEEYFSPEDIERFDSMLSAISKNLMKETDIPSVDIEAARQSGTRHEMRVQK